MNKTIPSLEINLQTQHGGLVQLNFRRFPSVLIPGDTLYILHCHLSRLLNAVENEEAINTLSDYCQEALEIVNERLNYYEDTMAEMEAELPYVKSINSKVKRGV